MGLHRSQVARILGITETTVRKYCDGTLLHPTIGADGCYEYTREEVKIALAAYARKKRIRARGKSKNQREGQKAGRAMMLFELGADLSDVVAELEITPDRARAWYRDWKRGFEDSTPAQRKELRVDFEKTSREQRMAAQDRRLEENGHVIPTDTTSGPITIGLEQNIVSNSDHEKAIAEILSKTKATG